MTTPENYCPWCDHVAHRCGGCGAPLEHNECSYGGPIGCCDDCQPLLEARS